MGIWSIVKSSVKAAGGKTKAGAKEGARRVGAWQTPSGTPPEWQAALGGISIVSGVVQLGVLYLVLRYFGVV